MQIQVSQVHPPGPGRKTGTVIDADGQRYECWPETLEGLYAGHRYEVEIKSREYNGREILKIARATKVEDLFRAGSQGGSQVGPPAVANHAAHVMRPAPPRGNGAPADALEVEFVAQVIAAMVRAHSPMVGSHDAVGETMAQLRDHYRRVFGGG